jgi:nucleosome binding factor SPN SPT16 subunit
MEQIIDSEESMTNEAFATLVEEILEDPSKISLKVPKEDVQSCYFPIVQSGGTYDLRVSAQSTDTKFSHDVITISLGARYRNYCSNIARTFFVDPPKKVSETYEVLLELQEACLEAMKPGSPLKEVYKAAVRFLQSRPGFEYLVDHLPKNLGFATGLDFREGTLLLSPKNSVSFKPGMVFCLSVGFQNVELTEADRAATPDKSPVRPFSVWIRAPTTCTVFLHHSFRFTGKEAVHICSDDSGHGQRYKRHSRCHDQDGQELDGRGVQHSRRRRSWQR